MNKMKVGILHPGEMGVSVAASAKDGGHSVYWASEGRSPETRSRAERAGLSNLETLAALCSTVEVIISVCPPHAAGEVLESVINEGFRGIFVEANAISPQKSILLAEESASHGISYVDGGIVGGPAWEPGSTILYLGGAGVEKIAALFTDGPLEIRILGDQIGHASALKMCFAAYSKGSTALISMVLAGAESLGVRSSLMELWSQDGSELAQESEARTRRVTRKAWRFAGEMDEIADTFAGEGLPDGFHRAARVIYDRLEHFGGRNVIPEIDEVLQSLLHPPG